VSRLGIGGFTYWKWQANAILWTSPKGDATYILAQQLIAAKLNILNGAGANAVASTIADADDWLTGHPLGSDPKMGDRDDGIALASTLDDYNNGLLGSDHCDDN